MTTSISDPAIPQHPLIDRTAIVVGASRGLGRGVASALVAAGADVAAVARNADDLGELGREAGVVRTEAVDATDPDVARRLLERHEPNLVVVVAGASPPLLPLQQQTWETLSVNWNADVRIAFNWLQAILLKPLAPGSRIILFSSGAALKGSPLSGGYAGAKATQRFLVAYAQEEARRAGLDLSFTVLMPRLTPRTELGRPAVRAYAQLAGQTDAEYLAQMGAPVTPEGAGAAVLELVLAEPSTLAAAYMLTGAGVTPLE
jgi:NAD(P)-dependent dehydrogenase (short-subunit alcohol dehydrogenase family)